MSSQPTPEEHQRIERLLDAANLPRDIAGTAERTAGSVFRLDHAGRRLACKLYQGPAAIERLRTEAAAYATLASEDVPVPRIHGFDQRARGMLRDWIDGQSLAQALRAEGAAGHAAAVERAWDGLTAAFAGARPSIDARRLASARRQRLREYQALADRVAASPVLQRMVPHWAAIEPDVRALASIVARDTVRTLPLDLSPTNLIMSADGPIFIDLEVVGLDFSAPSLCKATMLGHDPVRGRPGRSLFAVDADAQTGTPDEAFDAAHLLLALADAAGAWRNEDVDERQALILPRACPRRTPITQRIGSMLD